MAPETGLLPAPCRGRASLASRGWLCRPGRETSCCCSPARCTTTPCRPSARGCLCGRTSTRGRRGSPGGGWMNDEERYFFDLRGYLVVERVLTSCEVAELNALHDRQALPPP